MKRDIGVEVSSDLSQKKEADATIHHLAFYDTLTQLREKLIAEHSTFGQIDFAPGSVPTAFDLSGLGGAGEMGDAPFASAVTAFHLTNPIARASRICASCGRWRWSATVIRRRRCRHGS